MQTMHWSALVLVSVALAMAATGQTGTASLTFEDQTSDGTTVTVTAVELPQDGFVVIYNGTALSDMLGHSSLLSAGTHSNVTVEVHGLTDGATVTAALHADSDGDGDFAGDHPNGTGDDPINDTQDPFNITGGDTSDTDQALGVSDRALVRVVAPTAEPVRDEANGSQGAEPEGDDEVGEPGTDTPGLGIAALVAAVAVALAARRRG